MTMEYVHGAKVLFLQVSIKRFGLMWAVSL